MDVGLQAQVTYLTLELKSAHEQIRIYQKLFSILQDRQKNAEEARNFVLEDVQTSFQYHTTIDCTVKEALQAVCGS